MDWSTAILTDRRPNGAAKVRAARELPEAPFRPCRAIVHAGGILQTLPGSGRIEPSGWLTLYPDQPFETANGPLADVFALSFPPQQVRRVEWTRELDAFCGEEGDS